MEILENKLLRVAVSETGSLLTSVVDKTTQEELLFQKDPAFWPNQDVVIFPYIGISNFSVDGQPYPQTIRHGFPRKSEFSVVEKSHSSVTMLLESDEESKKVYPFDFALYVTTSLHEKTLQRRVKVVNKGTKSLPFSLGFHQGFKAAYDGSASLHFSKEPALYYPDRNDHFFPAEKSIYHQDEVLSKSLWSVNETWALPNDNYLISVDDGHHHRYHFHFDAPNIAIWSAGAGGDFLCVEPWWGFGTYDQMPSELSKRKDENVITGSKEFSFDIEIEHY